MRLTKDKQFWVPDNDIYNKWGAKYEIRQFKKIIKFLLNKRTAIDCGGHVGIWSKRLSPIFENVIAFEPVPRHIECHKKNCTESNITLNEYALSNKESLVDMKVYTGINTGKSTLEYKSDLVKNNSQIIQIQTKTLDSFNLSKVDFIKIDVEKHEVSLLEGATKTIENNNPIIFIEDHNYFYSRRKQNGINLLIKMGYEIIDYIGSYNYILKPSKQDVL